MLLHLEHECLDIYRRKVETSKRCKADLQLSLAEAKAEIAELASSLGERISLPQVYSTVAILSMPFSLFSVYFIKLRRLLFLIEYITVGYCFENKRDMLKRFSLVWTD